MNEISYVLLIQLYKLTASMPRFTVQCGIRRLTSDHGFRLVQILSTWKRWYMVLCRHEEAREVSGSPGFVMRR